MSDQRGNQGRNPRANSVNSDNKATPNNARNANNNYGEPNRYQSNSYQHNYQNNYHANYQNINTGGTYTSTNNASMMRDRNGDAQWALLPNPWRDYEIVRRKNRNPFIAFLLAVGSGITFARNLVFNIIFLILMFFILGGFFAISSLVKDGFSLNNVDLAQLEQQTLQAQVLYFDLEGQIQEIPFSNTKIDSIQREIQSALYGKQDHELVAIENALKLVAQDPNIKKVLIDIDGMGSISLSVASRIGKAMQIAKQYQDKDNAREVIVVGTHYTQAAYALAAYADRVVLDPLGEINFRGISISTLYFKDLLEKADITPYIFRAGHYKSAVEPFMLNAMSPDVKREYQAIAYKSWDLYKKHIAVRKSIKTPEVLPDANTYTNWIKQFNGNRARMQKAQGVVDDLMPLEQYFAKLATEVNADGDNPYRPAIITYQDYLMRHHLRTTGQASIGALSQIDVTNQQALALSVEKLTQLGDLNNTSSKLGASSSAIVKERSINVLASENSNQLSSNLKSTSASRSFISKDNAPKIAVIYGVGEITDFSEQVNDFTYDNLVPLIEQAQFDKNIVATVLYLNSPGGSVIASEKIRRALELYQSSGKPLIVSMNGTAASGAYMIACQADEIFATPSTITGSIGVFGLGFGAHKLLNRFGAYQDGVATNELAIEPIGKALPPSQQALLDMSVEKTYIDFIELVAKNRGLKPNEYHIYAEGQVFLADDAKIIGLVDKIGDLNDAIASAAIAAQHNINDIKIEHLAPGSHNNISGFENILFGLSYKALPLEFTEALLELKQHTKFINQNHPHSMIAISPISEPKL